MYVATSKQMKAYDEALLNEGYTIEELVDKASERLLSYFLEYKSIVIVSGPGNNGADGISLALKLFLQDKKVLLFVIGDVDRLSRANAFYLSEAKKSAVPIFLLNENTIHSFTQEAIKAEVVVDAMFGFGLHSEIRGIAKNVIEEMNQLYDTEIVSIDIPTGLNCDNGVPYQSIVCATKTITLTALKQAFLNAECHMYTGEILLETLDTKDLREQQGLAKLISPSWIKYHLKPRKYNGHKGDYGKIMHITGSFEYRGATLLSARASVYSGSGIVKVCSTKEVLQAVASNVPECTLLLREKEDIKEWISGSDAILIGCGLGLHIEAYTYVLEVVKQATIPLIIDADALTIIAENKELLKTRQAPIILTPHFGEFKRFVPYANETEVVDLARAFAKEYNIVLVLKGPNTIITDGSDVYRNSTANKAMATAGMGDVLAGMIVSFVGQGYSLKNAALIATYLHGQCGDEIAKTQYTVIPTHLINQIPIQMSKIMEDKNTQGTSRGY